MTRNKEDDGLRDIDVTKNRFGSTGFVSFGITETGFSFEAVETERPGSKSNGPSKKDLVLEALGQPKTIQTLINDTSISSGYMGVILRELTQEGKIKKDGKGVAAIYTKK
jgi:predicted Rossmann fold nucleotide-binding protein DprA/Smf involved in DNA uptake